MESSDLEKITAKHITSLVAAFVGGVAPGLIAIYFFKPAWLVEFDVPKLLLFSAAITMPLFFLNCLMVDSSLRHPGLYWDEKILMPGIFLTASFSLIPLFFMYIYPEFRSFRNFFALIVIGEGALWGIVTIVEIKKYGFAGLLGMDEIGIEKPVEKLIGLYEPGAEFDSHKIINALRANYSKVYNSFMRGKRVSVGHAAIGKAIAEFDGILVERIGDATSKNINDSQTSCSTWRRK